MLRRPLTEIVGEYRWRRQTHADECLRWDHPLGLDSLRRYACLLTGDHTWRERKPGELDLVLMTEHDRVYRCWKCGTNLISEAGSA